MKTVQLINQIKKGELDLDGVVKILEEERKTNCKKADKSEQKRREQQKAKV